MKSLVLKYIGIISFVVSLMLLSFLYIKTGILVKIDYQVPIIMLGILITNKSIILTAESKGTLYDIIKNDKDWYHSFQKSLSVPIVLSFVLVFLAIFSNIADICVNRCIDNNICIKDCNPYCVYLYDFFHIVNLTILITLIAVTARFMFYFFKFFKQKF